MSIVLAGSTSGSVTLQEPAVAGSTVLSLPATSGTLITTGSTGQVIPKAALPTGSVLQVVSSTFTSSFSSSSGSFVSIGLTASITPTSSSSKILILIDSFVRSDAANFLNATIYRNSTNLGSTFGLKGLYVNGAFIMPVPFAYYDSPATTSSTSYTLYMRSENATTFYLEAGGRVSTITLMEIAA